MIASRLSRAVSIPQKLIALENNPSEQIPRAPISRFAVTRSPTSSILARYASTGEAGATEKVKGQVIGIDLGKLNPS